MTVTITEVLLLVLVILATAGLVIFSRLAFQFQRTAGEVERLARNSAELVPSARRLIDKAESDLEQLRTLTSNTARIAEDVQAVTHEASSLSVALLRALDGNLSPRVRAAAVGARSGYAAFQRARSEWNPEETGNP